MPRTESAIVSQVVNRYGGRCVACRKYVPAGEGFATKWAGDSRHQLTCAEHTGTEQVSVTVFASGATSFRNRKGRCIDSPCCGCCSD